MVVNNAIFLLLYPKQGISNLDLNLPDDKIIIYRLTWNLLSVTFLL